MNNSQLLPMVVGVCGDAGGAEAVAPVIRVLQEEGRVQVCAFAYREAIEVWKRHHIAYHTLTESLTIRQASELIVAAQTSLVLAGTSYNSVQLEKRFTAAAREASTHSLVVLDFWTNYLLRFQDSEGRLAYIPDRMAVMDQLAYDELAALGVPSERLVITGQPAFDVLATWRMGVTLEQKQANRRILDISNEEKLVLFASQPLGELFGWTEADPQYLGYDEFEVVHALVAGLEDIATRRAVSITLLLRPHPREKTDWALLLHSQKIRILVSSTMDRRSQAIAADIVTGMNSAMLVETCYIGCPTISLQPGLRLPDALPTNRAGLSKPVYSFSEISAVIEQMLFDQVIYEDMKTTLKENLLDDKATQRVVKLVYQMIFEHVR